MSKMGNQFMNSDFRVCFHNLKTEDLKKYVDLAREEIERRESEEAAEAWNKLIKAIGDFLNVPGTMLSINEPFSAVKKERLSFDFDKETSIGYISDIY